jgi:hypothetical protein
MMSEFEAKLTRCEQYIANLTLRIAELEESSLGTGLIAADEFIKLLEQTLEGWQAAKTTLLESLDGSDGLP